MDRQSPGRRGEGARRGHHAIKEALDEARIDMPYATRVPLLHDQTEAIDGDRSAQREGWPAPDDGRPSRAGKRRQRS